MTQKKPNAWGLHNMLGNVWEWRRDWYEAKLPGGKDPEVTERRSGLVNRGGGWHNTSIYCRCASRFRHEPGHRGFNLGFRLAAVQVSK